MTEKRPHVAELAQILGKSEPWATAILGRIGVMPDDDGTFDPSQAAIALQHVLFDDPLRRREGTKPDWLTKAEMGATEHTCRDWLIDQFRDYGLEVDGRALRSGAQMTLRRPDGSEVQVVTYVTLKPKPSGQVGFTVNHLSNREYDWFAFVAKPLGKAYLKRRKEILASSRRRKADDLNRTSITVSAGTTDDLFENRIRELVEGK